MGVGTPKSRSDQKVVGSSPGRGGDNFLFFFILVENASAEMLLLPWSSKICPDFDSSSRVYLVSGLVSCARSEAQTEESRATTSLLNNRIWD